MPTFISTNNACERGVGPVVIHRKTGLGSQSERGSEFVARMQTIAATLREKGESLSAFIGAIARAVLAADPAPELLGRIGAAHGSALASFTAHGLTKVDLQP